MSRTSGIFTKCGNIGKEEISDSVKYEVQPQNQGSNSNFENGTRPKLFSQEEINDFGERYQSSQKYCWVA